MNPKEEKENVRTVGGTVKPSELSDILTCLVQAKEPVMVWGPPGLGKSDIARQVAERLNYQYVDVRPLIMERVDLMGLPYLIDVPEAATKRTMWGAPNFLPAETSEAGYLINLDELPAAKPDMMTALYQLVLDRQVGEYRLPPNAAVIACGNRVTDRGATHRMPTPLASRFTHLNLESSLEDWNQWAFENDVDPDIRFFLRFNSMHFNTFNPKQNEEQAYACPRTWAKLDRIRKSMAGLPLTIQREAMIGTVGTAPATAFWAYLRLKDSLPDPRTVISDPETAPILQDNATAQVALCASLYNLANRKNFDAIATYAMRLRPEVSEFLVGQCLRKDDSLKNTMGFMSWADYVVNAPAE